MKNLLLILLLTVLSIIGLNAQMYYPQPYLKLPVFGVKAGLNLSQIAGEDAYASSDPAWGIHFGALMQYNMMRTVYFQPEFIYTQKGYNHQYTLLGVDTKVEDSYNYLEVPLLLKVNFPASEVKIQPYIGPTFAYLVSAKAKVTDTIGSTSTTHIENIRDDMRVLDVGLAIGADVILVERVMLGARYTFGLTKIYDESMPGIGTDVQNGAFMLSIGYLFSRYNPRTD